VKYLERTFSSNDTCLLDLSAKGIEDLIPQVIDRMIGSGPAMNAKKSSRFFLSESGLSRRRLGMRSPFRTAIWIR